MSIQVMTLTQENKVTLVVIRFPKASKVYMVVLPNTIANHLLVQALLPLMVVVLVLQLLINLPKSYLPKVRNGSIHLGRKQESSKN